MGIRIHQLPPVIANQIAAGEVIERPASVVKELLENAYDAEADAITIEIGYGGLNQVKISDNGSGIVAEDLPLAMAAHATSKIRKLDDLYAIDSMGFRGEALASIASVAKVTLSSRPADQDHAMMVRVQGSELSLSPCARAPGTTIDVVDIFFNAPVRKRFLKSEKLEFQAIEAVVKRFALSAPHIAITLKHNGKLVLSLPSAANEQAQLTRITKLFGSSFMQDALFLDVEGGGMRLYGWISGPQYQRSQNDRQWVYINRRMVKDKLITHALKQAYDGLLHPGRFPACLLYFTIDTGAVDVNVHPTKHEVRFVQPRLVHDFFTSFLTKALNGAASSSPMVSEEQASDSNLESLSTISESYPAYSMRSEKKPLGGYDRDYLPQTKLVKQSDDNPWVILNTSYVVVFLHQNAHVVDAVALYKHWLLEQLQQAPMPLAQRPLLVPISYLLPLGIKKLEHLMEFLLPQLGVHLEYSSDDKLLIRSLPIMLPYLNIKHFLDALAEQEPKDVQVLLELMVESQTLDPRLLTGEERMALNQSLIRGKASQPFCRMLTEDDCRTFLYA
ncbi:MAG: DNA mismatch repair endonuclease MutL [Legionellales bacterium]